MIHKRIRVTGKVQGVFFRESTKNLANDLRLRGFVRNDPDGSVYVEVEGLEEDVSRIVTFCAAGPPRARVETIQVDEGKVVGYDRFEIRR